MGNIIENTRSTLAGFNHTIQRASGNTTRQVDLAIQLLFQGYIVMLQDHADYGGNIRMNKRLFGIVIYRLRIEHQALYSKDKLKVQAPKGDKNYYTIELKK